MESERFAKQMEFIVKIDELKSVIRQTALVDGSRQENVAEHSWHIAVMALLLTEYANTEGLDQLRVLKMLLLHDVVEVIAGDTFLYDDDSRVDQESREREAAGRIFGILPSDQAEELHGIWNEFEAQRTPEAMFAKALDALQPVVLGYANRGWSWRTHSIKKQEVLDHKKSMAKGSEYLWAYVQDLLKKAVNEGILKE